MSAFEAFVASPPQRHLSPGTMGGLARVHRPGTIWIILALLCFALFYSILFTALDAPLQIRLGFAVPGLLGLIILFWWLFGLRRKRRLLVCGAIVKAVPRPLKDPPRGLDQIVHLSYSFRDAKGIEHEGSSPIVWRGESISEAWICFDPQDPERNFCIPQPAPWQQ